MSKTPYELRFEIFQKASETLEYRYNMARDALMMKYDWETNSGKNPKFPEFPEYPSFSEISEYASRINDFVSNGSN
jgi:hypothetical protein